MSATSLRLWLLHIPAWLTWGPWKALPGSIQLLLSVMETAAAAVGDGWTLATICQYSLPSLPF